MLPETRDRINGPQFHGRSSDADDRSIAWTNRLTGISGIHFAGKKGKTRPPSWGMGRDKTLVDSFGILGRMDKMQFVLLGYSYSATEGKVCGDPS